MKRTDLTRHPEREGCIFHREGAKHTIYKNPVTGRLTSIPRHREIKENLAKKIWDDLGVARP